MNAFKKSPVLNRQCLRNKIEELSPLILNHVNLGISNTLFQATWSYYASDCQERLTSIRRRIEQNARIVVPTGGPRTQNFKNLNLSLTKSSLPPGVDLEDHVYHEFLSCFRSSDEGPAKVKKPPKRSTVQQKGLNAVQYPTPKQWNSWKREEREVQQMLMQSFDPYLTEELTTKLEKLRKLISRRPLVVLPIEPEEPEKPKKVASKKTKRRSSIKSQKQPTEVIPKPGPYVNPSSTAPIKSTKSPAKAARLGKLSTKDTSKASKSSLINLEIKDSILKATSRSNISKRSDRKGFKFNFKVEIIPEESDSHFEELSDNEGPKKLKSRTSPRKKFRRISQVSKLRENNSPAKVKNKKDKLKKEEFNPIDSLFFIPKKGQNEKKIPDIPIDSMFFLPQREQEELKESNSSRWILKNKHSDISYISQISLNNSAIKVIERHQQKEPQSPEDKPALEDNLKENTKTHDKDKLSKLYNQKPDETKENMDNLDVKKLRKPFNQNPYENPALSKDSVQENVNLNVEELRKPFVQIPEEKSALVEDLVKENMENIDLEKLRKPFSQYLYEEPSLSKDSVIENMKSHDKEKHAVLEDLVKENMENMDLEKLRKLFSQYSSEEPSLSKDSVIENMESHDKEKTDLVNENMENLDEKPATSNDFNKNNIKNPNEEILIKWFSKSPNNKHALLWDVSKKTIENSLEEKQGKMSEIVQINPGYKPHKFNWNSHFWRLPKKARAYNPFKPKRNRPKAKDPVRQRSFLSDIRQIESIRKEQNSNVTYIPFKANRAGNKFATGPNGLPLFLDQEYATEIKPESKDWPLPVGQKHMEFFKPFGLDKITGEQEYQVQAFPEIIWEKRKSSVFVPTDIRKSSVLDPTDIRMSMLKRSLSPPEVRIPFLDSDFNWNKKTANLSLSSAKTTPSSHVSSEDLIVAPPVIISDIIMEFLKTYGSEISFRDTFTNSMKPNKLDYYTDISIPITIKHDQPKMDKVKKIKPKKKKLSKKVLTKPSRREFPPCSLCNLVRRRQSELRPYMKRMQRQRQRLELKTYYNQKILKDRRCQEARKAYICGVLTRCYQTLKLCQELIELRLRQRSQEGQS